MPKPTCRVAALAAAALAALLVSGCSLQPDVSSRLPDQPTTREPAPPLSGPSLTGSRIDLEALRGHPVVVNFWASWCGPCRSEQPELNALVARYAPRGVRFVGVDMRDDSANALAFVHEFAVSYPSLFDPANDVAGTYNVAAPPTTLVIDSAGTIRSRLLGTFVDVPSTLDALLKGT
jgi:thiol-disulfide isomerase/thioredoxin